EYLVRYRTLVCTERNRARSFGQCLQVIPQYIRMIILPGQLARYDHRRSNSCIRHAAYECGLFPDTPSERSCSNDRDMVTSPSDNVPSEGKPFVGGEFVHLARQASGEQ